MNRIALGVLLAVLLAGCAMRTKPLDCGVGEVCHAGHHHHNPRHHRMHGLDEE